MKNCRTTRKLGKENAKNHLLQKGAIDVYNNILDEQVYLRESNRINSYGKSEYNIDTRFVQKDDVNPNRVIFNHPAFRAVDVLRGHISSEFADPQTLKYIQESMGDEQFTPAYEDFLNNTQTSQTTVNAVTQGKTKLIGLKTYLLGRAKERLATTEARIKENRGNSSEYKRLLKLKNELTDYIEGNEVKGIKGLETELQELNSIDSRNPALIAEYIEKEFDRLDELVKSHDSDHIAEAQTIIDFIKSMGVFDFVKISQQPHPLYLTSELYDEDKNFLLTDSLVKPFKDWATRATEYEEGNISKGIVGLSAQSAKILENQVNTNSKVEKMYGTIFTYKDIISGGEGLADTSWIDMMVMDIASGIFSHNGMLPQVMMNIFDNRLEKEYAWSKEAAEKIDALVPQVQAELKKLGYTIERLGILGSNAVTYDLFKQMIAGTNQSTGNLVHKYSNEWFEDYGEMNDKFWRAIKLATDTSDSMMKRFLFNKAKNERNSWLRRNTKLVIPSLLSDIVNDSEFSSLSEYFTSTSAEIEAHEKEIKAIVGDVFFKEMIESQKVKLKEYIVQRQHIIDELLSEEGVLQFNELSDRGQMAFRIWEAENNPFKTTQYMVSGATRVGSNDYHSKMFYNEQLPINKKHFDSNYATIESNPVLKQFYDAIKKTNGEIEDRLPYDIKEWLTPNSLPHQRKTIIELLLDKELGGFQAISKVARRIFDDIVSTIGIKEQSQLSSVNKDPNTGIPEYRINSTFISQNLNQIRNKFSLKTIRFVQELGGKFKINKHTSIPTKNITPIILQLLNKHSGNNFTLQILEQQFGTEIPVGKILYRAAQHEVAQEKSFDLPKIIKVHAHATAQYAARQELLPLMSLMKDHYNSIKKFHAQNTGKPLQDTDSTLNILAKESRARSIEQMESWFNRIALGNTGLTKQFGVTKRKVYTQAEREQIKELDLAINKSTDPEQKEKLEKIKAGLGKNIAASAVINAFLSAIRFKGLAFNFSSGLNNFVEGQVSNSITAASGTYMPPEYLHEVSVTEMVFGDLVKQVNPEKQSEKSAKALFLAKATDMLQDNTNELQKASNKSAFSKLRRLNPYYVTAKGEQYNQVPLMVGTLKAIKIKGIDGSESNVWDSLVATYNPITKQWTVKLKPEFRTEENISSWEKFKGQDYLDWKSHLKVTNNSTHGDYSQTGGNLAKSTIEGRAALEFKTWLPRTLYRVFAKEQDDLAIGVKGFKGLWRSHTMASGLMQGAIIGGYAFGPLGFGVGAIGGATLGGLLGAKSSLNITEELYLIIKMLFKKMVGMPINMGGSFVGKNRLINTNVADSYFSKMENGDFSKQDFNNFRGNLQMMSIMLSFFGMLMLTKAFLWDDDDETDDPRRIAHNLLANRLMGLASNTMMYANLIDLGKTIAVPAFYGYLVNVGKALKATSQLVQGDDTLLSGVDAGKSRTLKYSANAFLPGVFADPFSVGFGKQAERQFEVSPYDSMFFGEEKDAKREIQGMRASRRLELKDQGLMDDQIDAAIKQEFPKRRKGQSYVEKLEEIKAAKEPVAEEPVEE